MILFRKAFAGAAIFVSAVNKLVTRSAGAAGLMLFALADVLRREIWWVIINVAGLSVEAVFQAWLLEPRDQYDAINRVDVMCAWITTVFPALVVIFIVDAIWLAQIQGRDRRIARRRGLAAWLLICCVWLVALSLDPGVWCVLMLCSMGFGLPWHG